MAVGMTLALGGKRPPCPVISAGGDAGLVAPQGRHSWPSDQPELSGRALLAFIDGLQR